MMKARQEGDGREQHFCRKAAAGMPYPRYNDAHGDGRDIVLVLPMT